MSDLKSRYNRSPELHEPGPEQQAEREARRKAAEAPSARERFYEGRPELEALTREPVLSGNRVTLMEKAKAFRIDNLKARFAEEKHDLTAEEQQFALDVLALRISQTGSVRELLDHLHEEADRDFDQALSDVKEARAMRGRYAALKARYPRMAESQFTPERYLFRAI